MIFIAAENILRGRLIRIVGAELVRVRSQTTYYVLTRIKGICKVYLDRQRARQVA